MSRKNQQGFNPAEFLDDLIHAGLEQAGIEYNIIEFATEILGFDNLWTSQRAILKAFYGLELHPLEKEWLENLAKQNKSTWREGRRYRELILESGMRSSKTAIAAIIVSYEFWKLFKLEDPAAHYGLLKGSPIFITTVATTQQQSQDTVYGYACSYIQNANYFKPYIEKREILVDSTRIEVPAKKLTVLGGHSNQSGMVGKTAKLFVMDEAARYRESSNGEVDAKSMYANVGRSVATLKEHGLKVVVSSAWEDGDVMEWLYEQADPDILNQDILAFRLATWDVNPNLTRESPEISGDYRKDEVAARRDYEGIRPGTVENFFVRKAIEEAIKSDLKVETRPTEISVGARTYVGLELVAVEALTEGYSYAHADPGLKNDSFAFACGRAVPTALGNKVVIDAVLEWIPKDKGRGLVYPVNFENVEEVIFALHKARRFRKLTTDNWQHAGLTQKLYAQGIQAQDISFARNKQREMYTIARMKLNAGLVELPKNCDRLIKQLVNIQLVRGEKIDHPKTNPDGTVGQKDLADVVVSVIYHCSQEDKHLFVPNSRAKSPVQSLGKTHVAHLPSSRNLIKTLPYEIR